MTEQATDERSTYQTLRDAAAKIRDVASTLPQGWFTPRDPDLRIVLSAQYTPQALPVEPVAAFIEFFDPAIASAVADWLDGEAAILSEMPAFVETIDAVISNASGTTGVLRLGTTPDGGVQMSAESTPAALRLAELILAKA